MAEGGVISRVMCPDCAICGEPLDIGRPMCDWTLPGQWIYVPDYGRCVYMLHPSVGKIGFLEFPNGQIALEAPDVVGGPSIHTHEACLRGVCPDLYGDADDDDDDDFEDDDDDFYEGDGG